MNEYKSETLYARREYNRAVREQRSGLQSVRYLKGLNCLTFADYIQSNSKVAVWLIFYLSLFL
jgi:hypothetical protein